jgi:DNA primase
MTYLYPKGTQRGRLLYNHDALSVETDIPLMIVEGVFDTFPFWPHAAAVLGKPSHLQVAALIQAKRPIAVVLDGDAHDESLALSLRLQFEGVRAGCVKLPPRKDPDEMNKEDLLRAARECIGKSRAVPT